MLVLSRRLNEKIVFPGIQTTVQIVSVKPGLVRLGIDAPTEVAVLREELTRRPASRDESAPLAPTMRHRLDALGGGLAQLRSQLSAGRGIAAEETIHRMEQELQALRRQVAKAPACEAALT